MYCAVHCIVCCCITVRHYGRRKGALLIFCFCLFVVVVVVVVDVCLLAFQKI